MRSGKIRNPLPKPNSLNKPPIQTQDIMVTDDCGEGPEGPGQSLGGVQGAKGPEVLKIGHFIMDK